jgi:hypothetical protein
VWRELLLLSVLGVLSLLPLLPVLTAPLDFIPVTRGGSATVPLFNAWTILWNVKGIERGFQGWWDAPIFFPERQCFAFSEPMPLTACLQPLVRIFGSVALAYNCWLAGNLFLNGVTACWLLRRCGCSCGPAATAADSIGSTAVDLSLAVVVAAVDFAANCDRSSGSGCGVRSLREAGIRGCAGRDLSAGDLRASYAVFWAAAAVRWMGIGTVAVISAMAAAGMRSCSAGAATSSDDAFAGAAGSERAGV